MADAIAAYLDAAGLGRALRTVPLGAKLALPAGGRAPAALCLTPDQLLLVAARSRSEGTHVDLAAEPALRLQRGRLADRLRVGERSVEVGLRQRGDARQLLAVGRLRPLAPAGPRDEPGSRYVLEPSEVQRWALGALLAPDEELLALLPTATDVPIESPVLGETSAELGFVASDRRLRLFAVSDAGDLKEESVTPGRLSLEPAGAGKRRVRLGKSEFVIPASAAGLYAELGPALESTGGSRGLELARAAWRAAGLADAERTAAMLEQLAEHGHDRAAVAARLVRASLAFSAEPSSAPPRGLLGEGQRRSEPEPLAPPVPGIAGKPLAARVEQLPRGAVAELWREWDFEHAAGRAVLAELREQQAEPWALELHRALHDAQLERARDAEAKAVADLELAEHLEQCGEQRLASELLTRRLAELPDESLDELLPAPDADLTRGAGGQRVHIRVHELLLRVRGEPDRPDPRAAAELARLQPLVPRRLELLAAVGEGWVAEHARIAAACLAPGGLRAELETAPPPEVHPLPVAMLEQLLRHPVVREEQLLLSRLQGLLAEVDVPDLGVLRDYCEQISSQQEAAVCALELAGRALGVSGVEGYISRGRKSVGTRAYEGHPPFVLLGGRHLDPDPDYHLSRAELHFAVASEVAHVRFGHTRLTSSELWAGAMGMGRQGLDLALGILPLLRGAHLAGRIGSLLARVRSSPVQRVLGGARLLERASRKPRPGTSDLAPDSGGITAPNEALMAAHRLMQLTADRAGLLLCGDLRAALRAMFLVRPDLRAALPEVEEQGLVQVLGRRTESGHLTYQNLAVRAAALIAFFLSEEHAQLTGALTGHRD